MRKISVKKAPSGWVVTIVFTLLLSSTSLLAATPPAPVPKSGQTACYDTSGNSISCTGTGQDGDHQAGVAWPDPRFTDNNDGTVTDNLTGLIWLKNANCFGLRNWTTALADANTLNSGECGLTDGSVEGDWHLPNINELKRLVDASQAAPALPSGHPFTGVQQAQGSYYWSSTTSASSTASPSAWVVALDEGNMGFNSKDFDRYVWPVRGGQ